MKYQVSTRNTTENATKIEMKQTIKSNFLFLLKINQFQKYNSINILSFLKKI